jgi:hypothetical protein
MALRKEVVVEPLTWIRYSRLVPLLFFVLSYRYPVAISSESRVLPYVNSLQILLKLVC